MGKVHLVSLGCPKNRVDSEVILGLLAKQGIEHTPIVSEADIIIINTCAFIKEAVQESIEAILEGAEAKKSGRCRILVATGCLPQRYGREIARAIPEVDVWTGTGTFSRLPTLLDKKGEMVIDKPRYLYDHRTPRIITNSPHSVYIKIAEGCSHRCTFCLIPRLRGPYRSRQISSIIQEAEGLAAAGAKEITLVAQDTTAFGEDRGERGWLPRLLQRLRSLEGIQWIRLLYAYPHPASLSPSLLELLASGEKVLPYLDIPIQHIDQGILQRMGRRTSEKEIKGLVYYLKEQYPQIHLRTTLMVGFPGEGDKEFAKLLDFVREVEFTHLGVFVYSPEEGTKAARMKRVSKEVAEQRRGMIMELQQGISWKKNKGYIGKTLPVLIDGVGKDGLLVGRTEFQAPEIDGMVTIKNWEANRGDIVRVRITEAGPYDLAGEIVPKAST